MNDKKAMKVVRVESIDKHGRTLAVLSAQLGVPCILCYGAGFLVDGNPDVRVFGNNGEPK